MKHRWAQTLLEDIFASGVAPAAADGLLQPYEPMTEAQLIQRVYALMATNPKDDFYASVNKEWMDSSIIQPSYTMNGTIYEITYNTNQQVARLTEDVAASEHAAGTCVVTDPGLLEAAAALFTEENLEQLKLAARVSLLGGFGGFLSREFQDAATAFNSVLTWTTEQPSDEDLADLGALACIMQIEGQQAQPDYQTLYESVARTWRSAASREMRTYLSTLDVHAPDKLRGNRALQSLDEFFEAFDIRPGDGMYVAPEDRVQVW